MTEEANPGNGTSNEGTPAPTPAVVVEPTTPPAPAPAPVEYKFTAPDGQTYSDRLVASVTEFAQAHKLPPEAAQALIASRHGDLQEQAKALTDQVAGWKAKLLADPELGGDKLPENRAIVNKTITLGPPELAELLDKSGMVDHPVVFKWLHGIGKTLSEDRFVAAPSQPNGKPERNVAKALYPNNA